MASGRRRKRASGRRSSHRVRRALLCGAALAIAIAASVAYYEWSGRGDFASRLSTLAVLRGHLRRYAETRGRYPVCITDTLDDKPFCGQLDVDELEYVAGGESYPLGRHKVLFRERTAKRYGLRKGRFEVTEYEYRFREDAD